MRSASVSAVALLALIACGDPEPAPDAGTTNSPDAASTSVGNLGDACYPNGTCNGALVCAAGICAATQTDGGSVEPDAGSVEPDAGSVEPDAGSVEPDAGSVEPDAGGIQVGTLGGDCYPNDTCNGALVCVDGLCEEAPDSPDAGTGADAGVTPPTSHYWQFAAPWTTKRRDTAEVERIYVGTPAFVLVYADNAGTRGAELLRERVSPISNNRILLELDPNHDNDRHWEPHQTVHLAVYADRGTLSVYEPGVDPLLVDRDGHPMEKRIDLNFVSSTTDETSEYYDRNCTTEQFEDNRTDLPVDCRCNEALTGGLPICWAPGEAYPHGHRWGEGPAPADVNSVGREIGGGFLDVTRREFITAMNWKDGNRYTQSAGVIWAIDIDTGNRRVVSGVIDSPNGYVVTGQGYESNVTVGGVLRHTAPLPYLWDVQPGPDGYWYTYASDTQDNVEIVRVNPANGDRTLVWHVAVAGQNHAMGQCLTTRSGELSLQYNEKSFVMDPSGNFYLSFHDSGVGDGIVKIPANGSTCTPAMRLNVPTANQGAYPVIGSGATFQGQNIRGMGWVNGRIVFYTAVGNRLFSMDPATGNRTVVSSGASPQVGTGPSAIGENWFLWDEGTQLLWTSGGAADRFVAIDLATGDRQNLLQLSSSSPLVPGGYPVAHAPRGPLNPGTWSRQRFAWHPDNPDHVLMMVNSIGLTVYEIHTSNSYTLSL